MKRLIRAYAKLRQYLRNRDPLTKALWEIQAQLDTQNRLLTQMMAAMRHEGALPEISVSAPDAFQKPPVSGKPYEASFETMPLMLDARTYNAAHPLYDPKKVRNYSGRIFNADAPCGNAFYGKIRALAKGDSVPDRVWKPILSEAMAEVHAMPASKQVFERKAFIESYIAELADKYGAHYAPGWVRLDDALFLYWLVRQHRPRTVVQTGVCNGLSSAFIMLALDRNGDGGKLHVIDMPAVFNPADPVWTRRGKVYGVVIPEGKSSGWIVPDSCRDRFEVIVGDAKVHLPKLIDRLGSIDMFYHDSDHTYDHMMFEFGEARRKLKPGGLVVADDINWNASLWDFADACGVPSYNFQQTVGIAFF